ncbi:GGDEF domain-containing protein [Moorella naiadis (nom. illeg.)]|uniref:GGDEF domain-containing protein n=1 Tax=Moorella naiadis (nom. illeg.) TaxID=3093670 RepID=UPI003D9C7FDE
MAGLFHLSSERAKGGPGRKGQPGAGYFRPGQHENLNDIRGHQDGDEALKQVGRAIQKSVREGDVTARYGGDEFVSLYPGKGPRLETLRVRLEKHLQAIRFSGTEIPLSLRWGWRGFLQTGKT